MYRVLWWLGQDAYFDEGWNQRYFSVFQIIQESAFIVKPNRIWTAPPKERQPGSSTTWGNTQTPQRNTASLHRTMQRTHSSQKIVPPPTRRAVAVCLTASYVIWCDVMWYDIWYLVQWQSVESIDSGLAIGSNIDKKAWQYNSGPTHRGVTPTLRPSSPTRWFVELGTGTSRSEVDRLARGDRDSESWTRVERVGWEVALSWQCEWSKLRKWLRVKW